MMIRFPSISFHAKFIYSISCYFEKSIRSGFYRYGILLSILLMVCYTDFFAQIKISEKVSIGKQSSDIKKKEHNSISSAPHSLRALHNWEQTYLGVDKDIPMSRMRFKISATGCNMTIYSDYDYTGKLDFTLNDLLGTGYSVKLLLSTRTEWDTVYRYEHEHGASFQIFIDDELKSAADDYWFGDLFVDIAGSEIYYSDFGNQVLSYTLKSCGPIIGRLNRDYPKLTIIDGSEYLSFYDEVSDDSLGNSYFVEDFVDNGEFPLLVCDQPYYKEIPVYGVIESEVNGITAYDSVRIMPVENYDLIVKTEPHKIEPGDESLITLEYLTIFGDTSQFSYGQKFDVKLIEGAKYGTLVLANNDTSDVFNQTELPFSFKANENINRDSVEIYIKVETEIEEIGVIPEKDDRDMYSSNISGKNRTSFSTGNSYNDRTAQNKSNLAIVIPPYGPRKIFGIGRVVIVNNDSVDYFEIVILPDTLAVTDTLAFTETASIIVQAKNKDSNNVNIDPDRLVNIEITSNSDFGTFINLNGDTVFTNPPLLENIKYGDAQEGKIKFAAVKENPDSVVKCKIKTYLSGDTTKNGEASAVVLEQTLRIEISEPLRVEPIITGRRNDPEYDTYLKNIGNENRIDFRISHTRGGIRVKRHAVNLSSDYADGGGGHDHISPSRPCDSFSYTRNGRVFNIPAEDARRQNYGSFIALRGKSFITDSLHGKEFIRSYQDTITKFEYISSIWGGAAVLTLESFENPKLLKDTIMIKQEIPNLEPLPESENYVLVGGTDNHHGPPNYDTDHNHYGTSILCSAIKQIAMDYRQLHPGVKIRVNDMSLPSGGKFDIYGEWNGPHAQHREGKNVDISGLVETNNQLINIKRRKMREIITDVTRLSPIFHNPPHFHVYTK